MESKDQKKAYIYGLAAVLIWSTVASAFKIALSYMDPLQLLFYAVVFSTLTLLILLIVQGKIGQVAQMSMPNILKCALPGILNPFLYYIVLFKAYDLLPAQEAQPLNYTWAITLSLLSIPLLGQKLNARELIAIFTSYLGVVVISTHGNLLDIQFSNGFGVFLALFSTIIWALYWIYNTKSKTDPLIELFLNFCLGLPLVTIAMLIFSGPPPFELPAVLSAAYVGLFEMGITFALWLKALKLTEKTAKISNLIFLSPFLSLVLIHFILGEEILPSTLVGLLFIVGGNIIQQTGKK
ncbi:Permease of the drug/metabolite transporter (DMT) superfamily [Maridesulfovibrio ferrireducens]|uniref:Permease of the drug/metabolite transporter (DMT) superfamily n=1 Tax=Maridesulfovibrio ferrireducens TaxID=246191 RepID=A0A1G9HID1_9BACT|nr:DMT family transporter [Maridesulfovibrio ferrireducens]SDL12697.1 Permease of the drug/metabolite transporter (DMT) superfamily [Maridesulfovibrio ferrireducens]